MELKSSTVEKLRPLVGKSGWDYCILWKISHDQRFLEWVGSCCKGTADSSSIGGGEEQLFPAVSPCSAGSCRDFMFNHPRTRACDALAEVPSVIPLDSSGIYSEALIANQTRWFFLPSSPEPTILDETDGKTKVLVPVQGGLVEMFVAAQVPEDQHIIEFVMQQCTSAQHYPYEQEPTPNFLNYLIKDNGSGSQQQWIPPSTSSDHHNFPWDLSLDPSGLPGRQRTDGVVFFEGSADSALSEKQPPIMFDEAVAVDDELASEMAAAAAYENGMEMGRRSTRASIAASTVSGEIIGGHEKESVKRARRADSGGSDGSNQQEEDDEEQQKVERGGRKGQSKNLIAERRRRKKLNDRLLALRALVPNITKMDRASILGDAIVFVKKLQQEVKDLQDELERAVPEAEDDEKQAGGGSGEDDCNNNNNKVPVEAALNQNGPNHAPKQDDSIRGTGTGSSSMTKLVDPPKQYAKAEASDEKGHNQMEVQVEVFQVSRNEFFVKVFCEHKAGGFVRLMEAMSSLGLEVTNANVTTFWPLVESVFKVEKRDNEVVEAHQVRDSLIELTREPNGELQQETEPAPEVGGPDYDQHQYGRHQLHQHHLTSHHHLHYLHH